jgi:hypothetical protein
MTNLLISFLKGGSPFGTAADVRNRVLIIASSSSGENCAVKEPLLAAMFQNRRIYSRAVLYDVQNKMLQIRVGL